MSLAPDDRALFGFESEEWLERLHRSVASARLGTLGAYELLGEAGRGGQGVVFRARQPGTGREVALKRLLAGTFASAAARRRFEREVEAVTALSHPGIVTVYGVDVVDGAPLLAMEWIEGEPVTEWAEGRPRTEALALFLLVCDALQHAHQRGVLHRDLKPSNVIVDRSGRPRVLDFGLAKLAGDGRGTVSTSGEFLGTPAYAAPEQWRGEEVDARADVYSLGSILFEMLTGRRVLEGDGLELAVRAEQFEPLRPSSIVRSIPRELDAIVLQALAREREARYQSVDALSGDVRRYLAGEAVLAHPPGAWYLLRKLVARNRLASGLVVALVAATLVYALLSKRQANRLEEERNRAVAASEAESRALASAVEEKKRAEEEGRRVTAALAETERERQRATGEQEKSYAVVTFLLQDVIGAANPEVLGHEPTLVEILRAAALKVAERFGQTPEVEEAVRAILSDSFYSLGHYSDAEPQMRRALELRRAMPESTTSQVGKAEQRLGRLLRLLGSTREAEEYMLAAVAHYEAAVPPDPVGQSVALEDLCALYMSLDRTGEAYPIMKRLSQDPAVGQDLLVFAQGWIAYNDQRYPEARGLLEEWLAAQASHGERNDNVATVHQFLGVTHERLGELDLAEDSYRKAVEMSAEVFGERHPSTAEKAAGFVKFLVEKRQKGDAEGVELACRSLEAACATAENSMDVAWYAFFLGRVLALKGDHAQAEPAFAESLQIYADMAGPDDKHTLRCAEYLSMSLIENRKLDEAEELLVDVIERRRRVDGPRDSQVGVALGILASVYSARGALADAAELYAESIDILTPVPAARDNLVKTLERYAKVLRQQGDAQRAAELERRAAELGR